MNVLLIFANIALLFGVVKDFLDSSLQWENKNLINLILFLFSLLPTFFNIYVFLESDLPKMKTFLLSILRVSTMDYFNTYLENRCFEDNINVFGFKFGNWLFCNKSTGLLCTFHGGKLLVCGTKKPLDDDFLRTIEDDAILLNLEALEETINPIRIKEFETYTGPIKGGQSIFKIKIANVLSRVLGKSYKVVKIDNEKYSILCNGNLDDRILEFRLKFDGISIESHQTELKWQILGFASLQHFIDCSSIDICNYLGVYDLGNIKLKIDQQYKLSPTIVKLNKKETKETLLKDVTSSKEMLLFHLLFNYWSKNRSSGIIDDNRELKDGLLLHKHRRDVEIMHCLSPEDLVLNVCSGSSLYFVNYKVKKYYVEDNKVFDSLLSQTNNYLSSVLGDINSKTLKELSAFHLGTNSTDLKVAKMSSFLLENPSALSVNHLFRHELKDYRVKRLMVDVNYFFRMINYKGFRGLDKRLNITRFAVERCKTHQKLFQNNDFFNDDMRLDKLAEEEKSLKITMDNTRKAKPLKLIKKSIQNVVREKLKVSQEASVNLKMKLRSTYKSVLMGSMNKKDEDKTRCAELKVLECLLFEKPKKSRPATYFDEGLSRKPKKKAPIQPIEKKEKSLEWELVKKKTPGKLWSNKTEKLFEFLGDKTSKHFIPNRFSVLKGLDKENRGVLCEMSVNLKTAVNNIKEESMRKKEIDRMSNQESLQKQQAIKDMQAAIISRREKVEERKSKFLEKYPKMSGVMPRGQATLLGSNRLIYDTIIQTSGAKEMIDKNQNIFDFIMAYRDLNHEINSEALVSRTKMENLEKELEKLTGKKNTRKSYPQLYEMVNLIKEVIKDHGLLAD